MRIDTKETNSTTNQPTRPPYFPSPPIPRKSQSPDLFKYTQIKRIHQILSGNLKPKSHQKIIDIDLNLNIFYQIQESTSKASRPALANSFTTSSSNASSLTSLAVMSALNKIANQLISSSSLCTFLNCSQAPWKN